MFDTLIVCLKILADSRKKKHAKLPIIQSVYSRKSYFVGESKGKKTSAAADKAKQADKKAPSAAKDKDKGGKLSKEVRLNHDTVHSRFFFTSPLTPCGEGDSMKRISTLHPAAETPR